MLAQTFKNTHYTLSLAISLLNYKHTNWGFNTKLS